VGLALILAIVAVVVIDSFSMFSASQKVDSDARGAANAAKVMYAQTSNVVEAEKAAKDLLHGAGDKVISVTSTATAGAPVFTVSASRTAHTYVLKYGTHLPWVGKQIGRWLHPHSTGTSK
jgi:type II secretory pathway pseudopilin PulG